MAEKIKAVYVGTTQYDLAKAKKLYPDAVYYTNYKMTHQELVKWMRKNFTHGIVPMPDSLHWQLMLPSKVFAYLEAELKILPICWADSELDLFIRNGCKLRKRNSEKMVSIAKSLIAGDSH